MAKMNAFYAQSGGVTAVINASACGVIETARKHKSKIGKVYAGRNGIIGALTEDLIDTGKESAKAIAGLRYTPSGAFGSARYKLQEVRRGPLAVRAPDRSLQGARHRILLLQRRRRFGRYVSQGFAAVAAAGLPDRLRACAQDHGQRPADHRLLAGLRLRGEIPRGEHARGRIRCRFHGQDIHPGVRARGDGAARWLDHRGDGAGGREGRRRAARAAVSRDRLRRGHIPGQGRRSGHPIRLLLRRRFGRAAGAGRQVPVRRGLA